MTKTVARIAMTFFILLFCNNLNGKQPVNFDGGNPTPTCDPTGCKPPKMAITGQWK